MFAYGHTHTSMHTDSRFGHRDYIDRVLDSIPKTQMEKSQPLQDSGLCLLNSVVTWADYFSTSNCSFHTYKMKIRVSFHGYLYRSNSIK